MRDECNLAPQNIPRAVVSTLGSEVVLYCRLVSRRRPVRFRFGCSFSSKVAVIALRHFSNRCDIYEVVKCGSQIPVRQSFVTGMIGP